MLRICSKCGTVSGDEAEVCAFCDAPFLSPDESPETVALASSEPEWRLEVARRLEAYRARRRRICPDNSQSGLPFLDEYDTPESELPRREHLTESRPRPPERVEISVSQPELDFSAAASGRMRLHAALVPVAGLAERRRAGFLDTTFLLVSYGGFLALFRSLGGHLAFDKMDAAVYAATFFLFYGQYFALFTIFGGATPGMQLRGLSVVNLDGGLPGTRQLLWRSFGYLLSGGTLLLGFLWSLWDEDHLTWQDRISQTYLTAAEPLADSDALEASPGQHTFAHK